MPNKNEIAKELNENYVVIAEGIQTKLKVWGYENSYEKLKELTRSNTKITREVFDKFIDELEINKEKKDDLKKITPFNYR